jgi:hypothetical protein
MIRGASSNSEDMDVHFYFDLWGCVGNCNVLFFKNPNLQIYSLIKVVVHNMQSRIR